MAAEARETQIRAATEGKASSVTFEGIAGDQFAHTAGCRTAHVAAFLTKEPGDMGGISGDCGGMRGAGTHRETKLARPTAH